MLCGVCSDCAPTVYCTSCPSNRSLCQTCCDFVHRSKSRSGHKPKPICSQCLHVYGRVTCDNCQLRFCLDCVQQHVEACDGQQTVKKELPDDENQEIKYEVKQEAESCVPCQGSQARSSGRAKRPEVVDLCSDDEDEQEVPAAEPAGRPNHPRNPLSTRVKHEFACVPNTPSQNEQHGAPAADSHSLRTSAAPRTQVEEPGSPRVELAGLEGLVAEDNAPGQPTAPESADATAPSETAAARNYAAFFAPDPPLPAQSHSLHVSQKPAAVTKATDTGPAPVSTTVEHQADDQATDCVHEGPSQDATWVDVEDVLMKAEAEDHEVHLAVADNILDDSSDGSISGDDRETDEDIGSECEAEADELLGKMGIEIDVNERTVPDDDEMSDEPGSTDASRDISEESNDDSADENYVPDEEVFTGSKRKRPQVCSKSQAQPQNKKPRAKPRTAEERQAAKRAKEAEREAAKAAKQAKREAQKELRAKVKLEKDIENAKIATEIGPRFLFKKKSHPSVPDSMMQKIEKVLKAALEEGGTQEEKDHAMAIAQKLMTRYKLEQADVLGFGQCDAEEAAEAFDVLLRGLYKWWPEWGKTLTHVAEAMTGTRSCWSTPKPVKYTAGEKKDMEDGTRVTFYGVAADAKVAAYIFETAYNTVQAKGVERFPPGTKSSRVKSETGGWNEGSRTRVKKHDYRQGLADGLLKIAQANKRQRMKELEDKALEKKEEERKAVEAEQARLREEAEKEKRARAEAAAAAAAKKEQAEAAAKAAEREQQEAKEAEEQQKKAKAAAKRAADQKQAAEIAVQEKKKEHKRLKKEHPEWTWTPCVWAETTARIEAEKQAELSDAHADAARRAALQKQRDHKKAQEKESELKAAAVELAKQEAERAQREAGAVAAAREVAEKLQEIVENQKQAQQLTLYVPFAKKVVECAKQKIGSKTRKKHIPRTVMNHEEYNKGVKDSEQVHLGAQALPEAAANQLVS